MIIQQFQNHLNTFIKSNTNSFKFQTTSTKSRYINLVDDIYSFRHDFGISVLLQIFESIDSEFKNSYARKSKYHIQAYNFRTILTSLGEVRFRRTVYKNKFTGECYTHLDRVLGLDKYKYLDPKLEAVLVAKIADYSIAESARQINNIVSKNFDKPRQFISRQLARSILLRTDFDYEVVKVSTPKTINIMLDEKYVKLQREDNNSVMVKSAVIYESIKKVSKGRTKLTGKRVFIDIDKFSDKFYDFLFNTYDIDEIEQINIVGDGANWIKGVGSDLRSRDYKVNQYLDLFHFRKALHNVTKDENIKSICESYIVNSRKQFTVDLLDAIEITTKSGLKGKEYILNNHARIKRMFKDKIRCSMEGHISHNLASIYASRPRGYKISTLMKLIKLREARLNGVDITKELLKSRNDNPNQINIDYSLFDNQCKDTYSVPQKLKMLS